MIFTLCGGIICIGFIINQVSSRCLISTTSSIIDVINVDDFGDPLLVHSFPSPPGNINAVAFDSNNEILYVGGQGSGYQIHSLSMLDICIAISSNSSSVPFTFIGNSAASNWGLAYDSTENRLYSIRGSTTGDTAFARTNPVNGDSTQLTLTGVTNFKGDSLLESFDGSEALYYIRQGNSNWMKISNYREPSTTGSNVVQFSSVFDGASNNFFGLTWLNANEVLVYHYNSGNLSAVNTNTETSTHVGNLEGIRSYIRGIHLFPDRSCTDLCNNCPSDCQLGIADAQTSADSAQTDASQALADAATAQASADSAQTDATQALAVAAMAMQEIERLSRTLSDSDSNEALERAFIEDEKHIDNSQLNDGYDDEKHVSIDVSGETGVVIFITILFLNLACIYVCWKKET